GLDIPLWSPRSDDFPGLYVEARGRLERALDEEYRRLLYVALTRAEERLYIAGCHGRKKPIEDCWYNYIDRAFEALPDVIREERDGLAVRRITNPRTKAPDRAGKRTETTVENKIEPPPWLYQMAAA